jgi:hypothetical protein
MAGKAITLALVFTALLGAAAGCAPEPYYGNNVNSTGYNPDPNYGRRFIPGGNDGNATKWDYYRNYNGALHPGPEQIQ